jgi:hypothetical protein
MAFSIRSCVWQGAVLLCISLACYGVIYQWALRAVADNPHNTAASDWNIETMMAKYNYFPNASSINSIRGRVVDVVDVLRESTSETLEALRSKGATETLEHVPVPIVHPSAQAHSVSREELDTLKARIQLFLDWVSGLSDKDVKAVLNWSRLANNEIHLMNALARFFTLVEVNPAAYKSPDIGTLASHGYQCDSLQAAQQKLISKTIHMDICSEIEWYKLIHLCWPEASQFIDVGANKGYLGSLFVALWGLNGYGVTPAKVFDISTKLKAWETSRNPAGYCRSVFYLIRSIWRIET